MPYALFEKEYRLSRTFPTATDVWRCAEDCGLVIDEANGRQRLDDGYAIKPCPPDAEIEVLKLVGRFTKFSFDSDTQVVRVNASWDCGG